MIFELTIGAHTHRFRLKFGRWNEEDGRRSTSCVIQKADDPTIPRPQWIAIATGITTCSKSDLFVKETGRRISLDRVCNQVTREIGGAAKAAYYSRKRKTS